MTTPGLAFAGQHRQRLADDGALHAATAHAAGDLAGLGDRHGRAGQPRARALDVDDAGDRHTLAGLVPAVDVVEQFTHVLRPPCRRHGSAITRASSSMRGERMPFHETVNVREGGRHSPGQRRVAGRDLQRVDPDQPVGDALQALHLLGEEVGVTAVPAVGHDHDDRVAGQPAHAPLVVERAQPDAEPRPAAPVGDAGAGRPQRDVGIAAGELAGDPGQAGAERERLDLLSAGDGGVDEAQQRPWRTAPSSR